MITIKELHKTNEKQHKKLDISYVFPDNGIYVMTGLDAFERGDLTNMLTGCDSDYSGQILFDGMRIEETPKNMISYVSEDACFIPYLKLKDNFQMAFEIAGKSFSIRALSDLFEKVNLSYDNMGIMSFLSQRIDSLSSLEKKKVLIACCLAKESKVLLFDEPTVSLDEKEKEEFLTLLHILSKDVLILVYSDDESILDEHCRRLSFKDGILPYKANEFPSSDRKEISNQNSRNGISFSDFSKISLGLFRTSKVKSTVFLLLCLISVTFFSFFMSFESVEKNSVLINTQIDNRMDICLIKGANRDMDSNDTNNGFSAYQIEMLEKKEAHPTFDFNIKFPLDDKYRNQVSENDVLSHMQSMKIIELWMDCFTQLTQDERLKDNEKAKDPDRVSHIGISSLMADCLVQYGNFSISDVNELIGKKISGFEITNIYSTRDEAIAQEYWKKNKNAGPDELISLSQLVYAMPDFSQYYEALLGHPEIYSEDGDNYENDMPDPTIGEYYAYFSNGSKDKAIQFIHQLNYREGNKIYSADVLSPYQIGYDDAYPYRDTKKESLSFIYISILFAVLYVVVFVFLPSSERKRKIMAYQALKNMGCSRKSFFSMIMLETLVFVLLFLGLSTLCTFASFSIYNSICHLTYLTFDILAFSELALLLAIVSFAFAFHDYKKTF